MDRMVIPKHGSTSIVVFSSKSASSGGVRLDASRTLDETLLHIKERLGCSVMGLISRQGIPVNDLCQLNDGEIYFVRGSQEDKPSTDQTRQSPKKESALSLSSSRESEWITLNVGGHRFTTTRSTLTKEADSMLARMFASNCQSDAGGGVSPSGGASGAATWQSTRDCKGAYLIDRSPTYFEPILNYLRVGELVIDPGVNPRGVLAEARFYGLHSLVEVLEARIHDDEPPTDATPLTRRVLVEKLIGTPPDWELRCQGVNFEDANLSKLDLRHVNFKYALLRRANLSGANLSFCNFERADLAGARLDGANLLGVKMLCVNLEGASMRGCNLEDPAGTRANMEGANMKHVDLEGSHMASVNLRVATLKNANLQNCDLRGAVLAGADLESCDLSGCDLQEANLRGANLKDAAFELMLNPVHMSQAVR